MSGHDVIVLGGGAAGCMAAIQAGQRGRAVLLIDGGARVGGKIPISGGGRCNFTNRGASAEHYLSANPHFAKSALGRFTPSDTEAWVAAAGIAYHEKKLGQLFCTRTAWDMVDLLERDLAAAGVELKLGARVEGLERSADGGFRAFGEGWQASAPKAILALGGPSYPNLGATEVAWKIAKGLGLKLVDSAPALDGFVWNAEDASHFDGLQGLAIDVRLTTGGKSFDEAVLFTHKGLSGPAALQGSLYWKPGQLVELNLWPGTDAGEALLAFKRAFQRRYVVDWLAERLPRRLAERWDELMGPKLDKLERISDKALVEAALRFQKVSFIPAGTVGYHKAEVARGGISTDELDQRTLECKKVPGLHMVGEAVDVTGELGGYNFQWAWASGAAAGRAV
jgi:predicted Rossmann fold flavoprotein